MMFTIIFWVYWNNIITLFALQWIFTQFIIWFCILSKEHFDTKVYNRCFISVSSTWYTTHLTNLKLEFATHIDRSLPVIVSSYRLFFLHVLGTDINNCCQSMNLLYNYVFKKSQFVSSKEQWQHIPKQLFRYTESMTKKSIYFLASRYSVTH